MAPGIPPYPLVLKQANGFLSNRDLKQVWQEDIRNFFVSLPESKIELISMLFDITRRQIRSVWLILKGKKFMAGQNSNGIMF